MNYICSHCKKAIIIKQPFPYHSGFSDQGYLYCNRCPNILVFSIYDEFYTKLCNEKQPWGLMLEEQKFVEDNLYPCPCGCSFKFSAKPRCPHCLKEIPEITPLSGAETRSIYYVIVGDLINGEDKNVQIWKKSGEGCTK